MSPTQLPGKSFGRLRDRRNCDCDKCGRSFRSYRLRQNKDEKKAGVIRLTCRYCGHLIETVAVSKVITTLR